MAENIPNIPTGAVPPKKETGKVQPKKETVRINLPPKPTAAPTIKLPTLPPGGPTGLASAPAAPTLSTAPQAAAAPRAAAAPVATATAARPAAAAPARPAPVVAPVRAGLSGLDVGLAIAAAVLALAAVGSTAFLLTLFKPIGG